MTHIRQTILSIKIEYHFKRIRSLERRIKTAKEGCNALRAAINLHRYKAEKAIVEYEVCEGLRNAYGFWIGLRS
ncbi:MAG: hypothetical protein IKV44_07045 [Clostridia bacterium]|nr:hypothetical protein [Clostridia bacterium]